MHDTSTWRQAERIIHRACIDHASMQANGRDAVALEQYIANALRGAGLLKEID